KKVLDNLWEGAYILDNDRKIVYWNRAAENITGFKSDEVIGNNCSDNILCHMDEKGKELCIGSCPMVDILKGIEKIEANVFLHHKIGYRIPVRVIGVKIELEDTYALELFYPILDTHNFYENDIVRAAFIDNLTGALNRHGLETFFYSRYKEMGVLKKITGVIFADLDDFKKINDSYGHEIGDRVLYNFSQTIIKTLRNYDLVCRWGGEEFIIIAFVDKPEILKNITERIRILVASNFIEHKERIINYTASFGLTILKEEENILEAIKRADEFLYKAKINGKNKICSDLR
ncbi:MAG: sensor domain-containing diguanylate cyclase, partial [Brevinematales bacterium]|nr:sensor domain-containing diguanylate cyclase [Brevinematales bacterium]